MSTFTHIFMNTSQWSRQGKTITRIQITDQTNVVPDNYSEDKEDEELIAEAELDDLSVDKNAKSDTETDANNKSIPPTQEAAV